MMYSNRRQSFRAFWLTVCAVGAAGLLGGAAVLPAAASILDATGTTLLRQVTTNLDGTGIAVAQAEASASTNFPTFEVNPAWVGQPAALFTYYSTNGTSTNFADAVGAESDHANGVGMNFYGKSGGIAPNVARVDNYEADFFINNTIITATPPPIPAGLVNQSFIFDSTDINNQETADAYYDAYAAQYGTLFVSAVGNGGQVYPPGTCYNGIGVGDCDGGTSVGPTRDNGRSKPDLVTFGQATSFSTPFVSGAAAVLMQAGQRGDGGSDTNAAADARTVKALLLNGAIKPTNWTHTATAPLDPLFGAGLLNVFNSYMQLAGGKQANFVAGSVPAGGAHPPLAATNTIAAWSGWNLAALTNALGGIPPAPQDRLNYYYFEVTNAAANAGFTLTATLVWHRDPLVLQPATPNLNNLDLFLYDVATSNLIACSTSLVDNVEHLYVNGLPPGRYNLQVRKSAAAGQNVTSRETYALAWEFFALPLTISPTLTHATLSWPIYPAGFTLEATPDLAAPGWSPVNVTPAVSNGLNHVTIDTTTNAARFFRLRRP